MLACSGTGNVIEEFNFALPPQDGDFRLKPAPKLKMPFIKQKQNNGNQSIQKQNQDTPRITIVMK